MINLTLHNKASIAASSDIFQRVKNILFIEVARRYLPGELRQKGAYWVSLCPFHNEKTPSFYIFPDGFKCFGCGEYGDAIDLVTKLYSIRAIDAARLIIRDFRLQVDVEPVTPESIRKAKEAAFDRDLVLAFHKWRDNEYANLCAIYRAIGQVLVHGSPELKSEVIHLEPYYEYLLDILLYGSIESQIDLYKEMECVD